MRFSGRPVPTQVPYQSVLVALLAMFFVPPTLFAVANLLFDAQTRGQSEDHRSNESFLLLGFYFLYSFPFISIAAFVAQVGIRRGWHGWLRTTLASVLVAACSGTVAILVIAGLAARAVTLEIHPFADGFLSSLTYSLPLGLLYGFLARITLQLFMPNLYQPNPKQFA